MHRLYVTILAVQLAGCTSVDDLSLVAVRTIEVEDVSPLIKKDIRYLNKDTQQVLELTFSTVVDLVELENHYDNMYHSFSICTEDNQINENKTIKASLHMSHGSTIFGSRAQSNSMDDRRELNVLGKEPYKAYFTISRAPYKVKLLAGDQPPFSYDLRIKAADICFQIGGGDMWTGMHFRSNVLFIPKERIVSALTLEK